MPLLLLLLLLLSLHLPLPLFLPSLSPAPTPVISTEAVRLCRAASGETPALVFAFRPYPRTSALAFPLKIPANPPQIPKNPKKTAKNLWKPNKTH